MTSAPPPGAPDSWPEQPPYEPPPPYGQPPYGQPSYGQAPYSPPPYSPPPYGQPSYGQPPYGQPPYGQPAYGYPPYGYPAAPYGYGYQPSPAPGGVPLASMGRRFWGLVLDFLIIAVPTVIIAVLTGAYHWTTNENCDLDGTCTRQYDLGSWAPDLIALAIGLAYAAYFIGVRTQTIGHRAVGIRVIDAQTGQPIGPGRATLRWFVMIVTGAICTLGYWSPFFDSTRRQGWHDKAAQSIAVSTRRPPG